jgi:hypothetical protein
MQDRLPPLDEIFLLRTAGPYIGSTTDLWHREHRNSHAERSKYLAGVLPNDKRNIAMKALVL